MRELEFRNWVNGKISVKAARDAISRCRKIESSLSTDLDTEFQADGGEALIRKLMYSPTDERSGKPAPNGFDFKDGANIRFRMTDLRSAAKRYFKFCSEFSSQE